jgi:RNA polymerase sigma-70 factor, ECF subfamily
MPHEHAQVQPVELPMATAVLDADALERLFVAHERGLFNVVYRWTWDREDAAEIVQEAFGRLWDMRARVDPARARPLVYRIALNLAASRARWRRLRSFVGWQDERDDDRDDRGCVAEEDLLARERRAAIIAALEQLPDALRRTVVLCELTELSYEEIATVLNTNPGTVGSRRHAALARLRPLLGDLQERGRHAR